VPKDPIYRLSESELQRFGERCANLGAKQAVRDLGKKIDSLKGHLKTLAVTQDLVPEHVLLSWLDVSRKTLKRWNVPVDSTCGQTRFYHMPTVIEHLRDGENEQQEALESAT
jgi:hypothetical protein